MNINYKTLYAGFLLAALSFWLSPAIATEADLCAPFKNSVIDQALVDNMLHAADSNYLYQIKTNSSKMGFCVQSSIGLVKGEFARFQGGIALDHATDQTMVSIDLSSLDSNLLFSEALLNSDSFFHTEKYPKLTFVSTETRWLSDTKAIMKGKLTLRGVTKEVSFSVEIVELVDEKIGNVQGVNDNILVKATTTILRSEFGMQALTALVSDKVNLCMSVEAERYKPAEHSAALILP